VAATEYDFILTRNELIEESFRKIGILADGQSLSAARLATGNRKLNLILKRWSGDGFHLWTDVTETVTTTGAQAYVAMPTTNGMYAVEKAYWVDSSNDKSIERYTRRQYEDIYTKADVGDPQIFHHNVQEGRVYFWPVAATSKTIKLFGVRKLKDWETAASTGEFPSVWQDAIRYALAADLAEDYTLSIKEIQHLKGEAERYYRTARGKESDTSECSNMVRGYY
jgi:hypothetical protein